ncbi:MAG: hypothetical protein WC807_18455 [Hyphomicrobium sp.]|jgi:hypothetical protein
MNIETMSVNVTDKTISINGEGYACTDFPPTDANIVSLHWHPEKQGRCKGAVSLHVGGGYGIDEFTLLEPYVPAWEDAKERTLSRKAMEQAVAQGEFGAEPVEAEVIDLPRFLQSSEPASSPIAPDMQTRLAEHNARVENVINEAAKTFQGISRSENERISAMEARMETIESILRQVAEHFDQEAGGN